MSNEVEAEGANPPPGARFLTDQERTDHVAGVMEALTKQVGAFACPEAVPRMHAQTSAPHTPRRVRGSL
jgi:hypothetical protein